jgi:pimeloyl-ACP methyl ester carboxylesterase
VFPLDFDRQQESFSAGQQTDNAAAVGDETTIPMPRSPPLLVLLHGFPEFYLSWKLQITTFAASGYRVVAPDLRGYNLSEKPLSGYTINTLAEDIRQLILHVQSIGQPSVLNGDSTTAKGESPSSPVYLMGHDWGGVIAGAVAALCPNVVSKIVLVESTHLAALEDARIRRRTVPSSRLMSIGGVLRFCPPVIPELLLGYNRSWLLSNLFFPASRGMCDEVRDNPPVAHTESICCSSSTAASTATAETLEEQLYRDAMSQPLAVTCMLAYFRSLSKSLRQCRAHDKIRCPVMMIYSDCDAALARSHVECLQQTCERPVELFLVHRSKQSEPHHRRYWIHQEEPEQANRCVLRFLRAGGVTEKEASSVPKERLDADSAAL